MLKESSPDTSGANETGIQVYIGEETAIRTMRDCSVVTASYDLGRGIRGTIGIIGPKRMDYENVMNNLNTLRKQLDSVFRKDDDQ
jgi:heat-inducible transcriptional repressor